MPSENPIVVQDLHKSFGPKKVLDGISFQVAADETVAVLGRSGTGKSVLLKHIIGLEHPDSGSVSVAGQDIAALNTARLNEVRKRTGFLFQQAALYDSMTIGENVKFPLRRHTTMSAQEMDGRARELLSQVGMENDLEKFPSQISGGMQKRVGLARALALDPEILLFDEPTSALDPITAAEIAHLIAGLREHRRRAGVVVTHDIRSARLFADRLVLIDEGSIRAEGSFEELQKNRDPFVVRFLEDSAQLSR